ncbi:hypothetical protein SY86_07955 [Erwinia tracheiphila]|uniref:Uncharacterized protein n=1 Tax=Erwinia tracheiphila TaxID=65700 RepID=A0A0M2K7J5_9GAMM|nr:hypothetical protein AV903_12875 [Erwinia tracheiphila]EOS96044.1 hypothetical protein ETR_05018 [Erwinia tracheiphila PSU-1]KKF35365.1 hypothetical protein SY86_07955 [Erwinia tracheiphila]
MLLFYQAARSHQIRGNNVAADNLNTLVSIIVSPHFCGLTSSEGNEWALTEINTFTYFPEVTGLTLSLQTFNVIF